MSLVICLRAEQTSRGRTANQGSARAWHCRHGDVTSVRHPGRMHGPRTFNIYICYFNVTRMCLKEIFIVCSIMLLPGASETRDCWMSVDLNGYRPISDIYAGIYMYVSVTFSFVLFIYLIVCLFIWCFVQFFPQQYVRSFREHREKSQDWE